MSTRRWPAEQAFRMRVSMSATGSVRFIPCSPYQLALRTPGISPLRASSRKQIRHRPNLRSTARDRPQRWQRRTVRTLNLGVRLARSIQQVFAIYSPLCRALRRLTAERPAELPQQRQGEVIAPGRGHDRDVHPVDLLDFVVVDFREDHLLLDAEGVVPPAVEAPVRQAAEVAH